MDFRKVITGVVISMVVVPRVAEYFDSTSMIADTLLEQMKNANNNEDRLQAWKIAVNEIKLHPYKHTVYLGLKAVGDSFVIYTVVIPRIHAWLKETFDYVRYLYNTSKEYLIAQYSTVQAKIIQLSESAKNVQNTNETNVLKTAFAQWVNEYVQQLSTKTTSPDASSIWNIIKQLVGFLLNSFDFVATKVISDLPKIWPVVQMEVLKYLIQIVGCTLYYFDKINEKWSFSSRTIELRLLRPSDLLALTWNDA